MNVTYVPQMDFQLGSRTVNSSFNSLTSKGTALRLNFSVSYILSVKRVIGVYKAPDLSSLKTMSLRDHKNSDSDHIDLILYLFLLLEKWHPQPPETSKEISPRLTNTATAGYIGFVLALSSGQLSDNLLCSLWKSE